MRAALVLLLCFLLTVGVQAQDEHDHSGHDHEQHQGHDHEPPGTHGGFDIDARQHAEDVENAVFEFMVRNFFTQPWRDSKAAEVMFGRAVPVWVLVFLLLIVRRFREPR